MRKYNHYILIYSDYSQGKRIGYHISDTEDKTELMSEIIEKLKKEYFKLNFGLHFLQNESDTWESVVEYDNFFEDIYIVKSVNQLRKRIKKSLIIRDSDIFKIYEWEKYKKENKEKSENEKIIDYSIDSSSYFKITKDVPSFLQSINNIIKNKEKHLKNGKN